MFRSRRSSTFSKRARQFVWPRTGILRAWRYLMHRLARMKVTPHRLAIGFAAGAFVSFTPFVGLHFLLAAAVALLIRGNIIASAVGTAVGNPLTFPFIWIASYNLGARMLGWETKEAISIDVASPAVAAGAIARFFSSLWQSIEPLLLPMMLGGVPLGLVCAAICYWIVRSTVSRFQARRLAGKALAGRSAGVR